MASLYERLKSARPIAKRAAEEKPSELMVISRRVPLGEVHGSAFDSQTLAWMSNGIIQEGFSPGELLFFDTETTGLSRGAGTVAFLIGYGRIDGQELEITQVLMRDYPQEARLLETFLNQVRSSRCLVSFNGSGFDLPLLQGRLIMNRLGEDLSRWPHLDLLHTARRIFKLRLGRCSLTRLEQVVFNHVRENDLPGAQVPARYFEYLNTRDESLLIDVLDHNRQDILALVWLYLRMAALYANPLVSAHHQDLFSLGRAFERLGQSDRAITCYKACSEKTVRDLARLRMAEMYRKQRMDQEAVTAFEDLRQSGRVSARVYISLAKIYEHRFRDPQRALEITRQGMLYCSQRLGCDCSEDRDFQDLERRSLRLMRKVEKIR